MRRVSVCRGLKNGRSGWLLRWHDHDAPEAPLRLSYWFVDEQEARAVKKAMQSGLTFEQALRRVWAA